MTCIWQNTNLKQVSVFLSLSFIFFYFYFLFIFIHFVHNNELKALTSPCFLHEANQRHDFNSFVVVGGGLFVFKSPYCAFSATPPPPPPTCLATNLDQCLKIDQKYMSQSAFLLHIAVRSE